METVLRTYRTKDVERLANEAGTDPAVYRELLAEISDRYGWGERRDTAKGPGTGMREWSRQEAEAMIQVIVLRDQGFGFDEVDQLVAGGPQTVLKPIVELLERSCHVISRAMEPTAA